MGEAGNKAVNFDPIVIKSREYLDQVIASQVRPKVSCKIYPIDVPGGVVYVVDADKVKLPTKRKLIVVIQETKLCE